MNRRRLAFSLLAAGLLSITAVQVGALWKHQPEEPAPPASAGRENSFGAEMGKTLSKHDAEIMRKVNARLEKDPTDMEAFLLQSLLLFRTGHLEQALGILDDLTRRAPNFHLAHLIRGDLLLIQFQKADDIGSNLLLQNLAGGDNEQLERLRTEASARLQGYLTLIDGQRIPRGLVQLAPGIRHVLLVDKNQHRLYVYENSDSDQPPRLVGDFYCVIGKLPGNKKVRGDQRTPEGVYFLTGSIPDEKLPDRYGHMAYPLNYPNEFDGRLGKTGDGIWLHGTDKDFYSRPPLDSDGCVVLANDDLQRVARFISPGVTPMIISDHLDWLSPEQWHQRRKELRAQVEQWREDWESCRVEDYLSHYASDFYSDGCNLSRWRERKRQVARSKEYQQIKISDLTLLAYPQGASEGRELVVAGFRQEYRSNNFTSDMGKRLYLVKEGQDWRIWYEGSL